MQVRFPRLAERVASEIIRPSGSKSSKPACSPTPGSRPSMTRWRRSSGLPPNCSGLACARASPRPNSRPGWAPANPRSPGWKTVVRFRAPRRCCAMPRQPAASFRCGYRRRDASFGRRDLIDLLERCVRGGTSTPTLPRKRERGRDRESTLASRCLIDCFAEPVIGRIRATRWLAMTVSGTARRQFPRFKVSEAKRASTMSRPLPVISCRDE